MYWIKKLWKNIYKIVVNKNAVESVTILWTFTEHLRNTVSKRDTNPFQW